MGESPLKFPSKQGAPQRRQRCRRQVAHAAAQDTRWFASLACLKSKGIKGCSPRYSTNELSNGELVCWATAMPVITSLRAPCASPSAILRPAVDVTRSQAPCCSRTPATACSESGNLVSHLPSFGRSPCLQAIGRSITKPTHVAWASSSTRCRRRQERAPPLARQSSVGRAGPPCPSPSPSHSGGGSAGPATQQDPNPSPSGGGRTAPLQPPFPRGGGSTAAQRLSPRACYGGGQHSSPSPRQPRLPRPRRSWRLRWTSTSGACR